MSKRLRRYISTISAVTLTAILVSDSAWAAGLEEARRGFGFGKALGLLCCLAVLGLVGIGVLIGVLASRRRR
jgi:hypothetical protein